MCILIMGCSGNYGNLKTQPEEDSKVTQRELIDTWTNYNINFTRDRYERTDRPFKVTIIVFDLKTDERKMLFGNNWSAVKDQETWTEIVEDNTTIDGNISPVWASDSMTGVREIWGPDNQLYGYIIHQIPDLVSAKVVVENTMRLYYHRASYGAGP